MTVKTSSWRQKLRHDVKKFIMTSKIRHAVKNTSWCQKISSRHQKKVMTAKTSSWQQKTCHDSKNFIMTSKCSSWCQKPVKTSKTSSWRQKVTLKIHDYVKITSWRKKNIFMTSKKVMPAKKVMPSKNLSWCQKICHDVISMLWRQKHVVMSKTCCDIKTCCDVKNMLWSQKHVTSKTCCDVKNMLWRQKHVVIASKIRQDDNNIFAHIYHL